MERKQTWQGFSSVSSYKVKTKKNLIYLSDPYNTASSNLLKKMNSADQLTCISIALNGGLIEENNKL